MRTFRLARISSCIFSIGASAALMVPRAAAEPSVARSATYRTASGPIPARSVGSPTDGSLVGGVPLKERAELRLRWPDGPRWALPALVSMLERAARRVHVRFPGSILLVGDLSRREGGSLAGHVSHTSGRDADVAFYYSDPQGRSVRTERLIPVGASGRVQAERLAPTLRFDEARNWALIESFLTDPAVVVQRIFVAAPLKQRLLEYARRRRVNQDVVERAESAMRQAGPGSPHDDHFHVRIACPRDQADVCIAEPEAVQRPARRRAAVLEGLAALRR